MWCAQGILRPHTEHPLGAPARRARRGGRDLCNFRYVDVPSSRASLSFTGTGGRSLIFAWRLRRPTDPSGVNLLAGAVALDASSLSAPTGLLSAAAPYVVTLTVTNFLGASATREWVCTRFTVSEQRAHLGCRMHTQTSVQGTTRPVV